METAAEREGRLGKGENSIFCKIFYHMRPQAVYICDRDLPSPKPKGMQNQLHCSDDTKEYVGIKAPTSRGCPREKLDRISSVSEL